MSPFDVNMAVDAGFDAVVPYVGVGVGEVTGLVQDAIFSRPPDAGVDTTASSSAARTPRWRSTCSTPRKKAMVPPFQVSSVRRPRRVLHHSARRWSPRWKRRFEKKFERGLKGTRIAVFGATGVVGFCTAVIAAKEGAKVTIIGP